MRIDILRKEIFNWLAEEEKSAQERGNSSKTVNKERLMS